jgi:hypothetical protein
MAPRRQLAGQGCTLGRSQFVGQGSLSTFAPIIGYGLRR